VFILVLVEFFLEFLFVPDFVIVGAIWDADILILPVFWFWAFIQFCNEFVACLADGTGEGAIEEYTVLADIDHVFVLSVV
jgi:hypothetical protein